MKKKLLSLSLLALAWFTTGSAQAWDEPSQVDGVYQIGTASELEWFAEYVNGVTDDMATNTPEESNARLSAQAVLTADIDMTGIEHAPIGRYTKEDGSVRDTYKFAGKFDGQFHTISNLVINRPDDEAIGLFGFCRGNAKIKNIIMAASCSIKGKNRVGSIVGLIQTNTGASDGLEILNCVSYATLTTTSGAAGMIGAGCEQYPYFDMENCVNAGTVNAVNKGTAFCGWNKSAGGNAKVWNCLNTAEIKELDTGGNGGQLFRGSNRSVANCYDTFTAKDYGKYQGEKPTYNTTDPLHSGEICYLLNTALRSDLAPNANPNAHPFTQDLSDPNSIPLPIPGKTVYEVAKYKCDGTLKVPIYYSNTDDSSQDPHQFDATGFCTVCGAINTEFVAKSEDGFYHLSTVAQVEWFSAMVKLGYGAMNVKLDADIDFGDVADAHMPIGTSGKKYFGHFDGQKHRIKGMVLTTAANLSNPDYDGLGFFGSVRGGGTSVDGIYTNEVIIENLIIDESCSVEHNKNFAAGLIAHINSRNDDNSNIIIRNCGNEANVTTSGKNAAGILGCVEATNVGLKLYNLWNKGKIVGNGGESAAICAWTGQRNVNGEVDVEGCWNIGEVTGIDDNHYNMIRRNSNIVPRNIVDLCIANGAKGNQGTVSAWNTTDPISSGELCYLLNEDQDPIVYTQTLGTDAMPVYGTTSQQVYASGLRCDGAGIGFTNTETDISSLEPPHHTPKTNGFCSVCNQNTITSLSEENGYLLVSNAAELEFLSSIVNAASGATKNAKLTANIDMDGVTHTPIGYNNNNKFCGEFDGQGHSIFNMSIYSQNSKVGVFGALRGGTLVKNLIVDASCQITGVNHLGGIAGSCQTKNNSNVTVENCINEASIHGTGYGVGGIIGQNESSDLPVNISNCGNSGSIQADDANACAVIGWAGGANAEIAINNFWNTGTITKGSNDHKERDGHAEGDALAFNLFNATQTAMDANIHLTNCFDASATEARSQGTLLNASAASSGELTYKIGGVWRQTLGTDEHPVFSGLVVNAGKWFNDATDDVYYNLENGNYTVYQLNLDETNTKYAVPANVTAKNVTMTRALATGKWNTFCSPVAIAKSNFSAVKELTGATNNNGNYSMTFADETGDNLVAGKPYMVQVNENKSNLTASNVAVAAAGTSTASETFNGLTFNGNFTNGLAPRNSFIISNNVFYNVDSDVTLKAFRGYITTTSGNNVKALTFDFDDDATAIEMVNGQSSMVNGQPIYNLAGQRINKMQKGINIVNGKKILY